MKQNALFNIAKLKERLQTGPYIPEPGDTVYLPNINDGIQAEVVSVDKTRLHEEFAHPIKCWIPKLKMHVWQKKDDISTKPTPKQ